LLGSISRVFKGRSAEQADEDVAACCSIVPACTAGRLPAPHAASSTSCGGSPAVPACWSPPFALADQSAPRCTARSVSPVLVLTSTSPVLEAVHQLQMLLAFIKTHAVSAVRARLHRDGVGTALLREAPAQRRPSQGQARRQALRLSEEGQMLHLCHGVGTDERSQRSRTLITPCRKLFSVGNDADSRKAGSHAVADGSGMPSLAALCFKRECYENFVSPPPLSRAPFCFLQPRTRTVPSHSVGAVRCRHTEPAAMIFQEFGSGKFLSRSRAASASAASSSCPASLRTCGRARDPSRGRTVLRQLSRSVAADGAAKV